MHELIGLPVLSALQIRDFIVLQSWKHPCKNGPVQPPRLTGSRVTTECTLRDA